MLVCARRYGDVKKILASTLAIKGDYPCRYEVQVQRVPVEKNMFNDV